MILSELSEVVWNFYQEGRPKATGQTFDQSDVAQKLKMAISNIIRRLFYDAKKLNDGDEYYFESPLLQIKSFTLSDPDASGRRIADMSEFDLYRLPKNAHFTNVYSTNCTTGEIQPLTQVQPGEETFYLKPKFKSFEFYVPKGRALHTYHLPPCVKGLDVETTYEVPDADISLDVAFEASTVVISQMLQIPGFTDTATDNPYISPQLRLKQKLTQAQQQPQTNP